MTLINEIENRLCEIPVIDIHTHVDAEHLSARGLYDVLLYHMIVSELYASGCPSGSRLSEDPSEEEQEERITEALPYLENIQNTSCFWGARIILKDLYEWDKPVTHENWRYIDGIIREKSKDKNWSREILGRAKIEKVSTELWRRKDGSADDVLKYSLEWAFFTRTQWKQYDTALLELENAWSQEMPSAPLPVTLKTGTLKHKKKIRTLDDVNNAIDYYCEHIPFEEVFSVAQHFSTDINYRLVDDNEMEVALRKREFASELERDIYANYILEAFLRKLEQINRDFVYLFSCGAEPLPYETGSKLRSHTLFQLADIFQRHPRIKFQAFFANAAQNQALCSLVRELPNLSVAGYWWHTFFPSSISRIIDERLDMLPLNKQIGFFSDGYCLDWSYAKLQIVRKQFANILAHKIEQQQYDLTSALLIAKKIFYETPVTFLKI